MGGARFAGVESGKREKYGTGKYLPDLPDTMYSEAVQNEGERCPKCL